MRLLSLLPAALLPFCAGVPAIGVGQPAANVAAELARAANVLPELAVPEARPARPALRHALGELAAHFEVFENPRLRGDVARANDDVARRQHTQLTRATLWYELTKQQALYLEYKLMLPGHLLLGKGDRVAMHAGVETRYPFLDEDFIDLASTLSPSYKLRGFEDKWLLRRVAETLLPKEIARPPKQMFKARALCELTPQPRWIAQLLSPPSLRQTGYFSVDSVRHERALQTLLPSTFPRRYVLDGAFTALVMTQLWHHLFLGGGLCELPVWQPDASSSDPPPSFLGNQHAL